MGFGDTAKKLQKVTSAAEDLYEKMNQVRDQLQSLREEVETTSQQVDEIERDLAEQRVLLEAIADEQGLDADAIVADAHIEDVTASTESTATDTDSGGEEIVASTGSSDSEPEADGGQ